MLNEIISAIGKDYINNKQTEFISTTNTIYARIYCDRIEHYDITYIKKEVSENQLELIEWCKSREIFSKNLDSHKAIDVEHYKKVINSCVPYSIIFNYIRFAEKDITKKSNIKDAFYILSKDYLNVFDCEQYIDYYMGIFEVILNVIKENKLKNNINIKLFLDVDIEQYKKSYFRYLEEKIFDTKGLTYKEKDNKFGRCSKFYNLNKDKPLLGYMDNIKEIHLLETKQAQLVSNLYNYMSYKKQEKLNIGIQKISYKMELSDSTHKWYLENMAMNPYSDSNDIIYFNVQNILCLKNFKETIIDSYNHLRKYIYYLIDKKTLIKENKNIYNYLCHRYQECIDNLDNLSMSKFKKLYENLIYDLYKIFIKKDDMYKIGVILNFDICLQDWLFKNNMKGKIVMILKMIEEKMERNEYHIDSHEEFFFMSGQMVKYLKLKTHTNNITNKLFSAYTLLKQTKQMIELLKTDKARLDYDGSAKYSSRSNNVMFSILDYYTKNEKDLAFMDTTYFDKGLYYGRNLIYTKKGSNENGK